MTTRTMYDADEPYDIPRDAEMVAGYVDGIYAWSATEWGWFPRSEKVTISAVGAQWDVHFYDLEPGCIWPPENVLPLIVTARANGRWPAVYCNQINHWPYIRQMFRMRGMEEPPYLVANYDGVAVIPDGAVGKQYKHPPQIGKHYDLWVISSSWKPGRKGSDDMLKDEIIRTFPADFREIGDNTRTEVVEFDAATTIKFTNLYSGANYNNINRANDRLDAVESQLTAISGVCQRILNRLDDSTPTVDVEAVAHRAKELVGEDLLDEEANAGQ